MSAGTDNFSVTCAVFHYQKISSPPLVLRGKKTEAVQSPRHEAGSLMLIRRVFGFLSQFKWGVSLLPAPVQAEMQLCFSFSFSLKLPPFSILPYLPLKTFPVLTEIRFLFTDIKNYENVLNINLLSSNIGKNKRGKDAQSLKQYQSVT